MRFLVKRLVAWVGVSATLVGAAGCSRHDSTPATGEAPAASASVGEATAEAGPSRSPIPKELVDAVVNPEHLPAYSGPTGSVEGTIFVVGPSAPDVKIDVSQCPAALDTYGKLFREGTPAAPNGPRPLADTVVIVVGYSRVVHPRKAAGEARHDQRQLRDTPRAHHDDVRAAARDSQSIDQIAFAPTIDSEVSPAVMMAAPLEMGDPIRLYPRRPGHSGMGDIMQPFVHQDLYVLRHPLHTVSDVNGHYRIDGVPVGKMTVRALHPTVASEAQAPIDIVANVVAKADLTLEYAPKAPKVDDSKRAPIFR